MKLIMENWRGYQNKTERHLNEGAELEMIQMILNFATDGGTALAAAGMVLGAAKATGQSPGAMINKIETAARSAGMGIADNIGDMLIKPIRALLKGKPEQ